MKQIFFYILDRLRFLIHCKLGLFKIPKHKRIFNQEGLISKIKGSGMEAVVDSVGMTNDRVKFKDFLDYSYNKNICVSSDYGGENSQSAYNTYTFTFYTFSTLKKWLKETDKLKKVKGYADKAPEYKHISPKTRQGKLHDWLGVTKNHFKGFIVTFAVDKQIDSLFAQSKTDLFNLLTSQSHFKNCVYGEYIVEKIFRISNFMSLIFAHTVEEDGGFFWMSDRDSINQKPEYWKFSTKVHNHVLRHYCEHLTCAKKGYARRFSKKDVFSNDFLSISDLIAGAYDDYFNNFQNANNPQLMLSSLKGKTKELLSALHDIPSFAYVIEKQADNGVSCKGIQIVVNE